MLWQVTWSIPNHQWGQATNYPTNFQFYLFILSKISHEAASVRDRHILVDRNQLG